MTPLQVPTPSILMQTARGAGWAVAWRWATRAIGLVNTFFLARLLSPSDFGLVALATGFSQAIGMLSALGIEEAVIRERAPTRETYDTAFTINLIRGLATTVVLCAIAWPVAGFFKDERLFPVLLALACFSFVTSFENIATVEFQRDFAFEREFRLLIIPRIISVVVTVGTAVATHSCWALIAGIGTQQVIWTLMGYRMHPFRPRLSLRAWRSLSRFSIWSWAISLVSMARDRVDSFVLARVLNVADAGLFNVAQDVAIIPTYEIAGPLAKACLPGFAAILRTGGQPAPLYLRIITTVFLIVLPAGVGASLVAGPLVLLALGPKWLIAVPLVQVMSVASVTFVLGTVTYTLLAAQGRLQATFAIGAFAMPIRVVLSILLILRFGLIGAALAWSLATGLENGLYLAVACRSFALRPRAIAARLWRPLVGATAMACVLTTAGLSWNQVATKGGAIEQLAIGVPLGMVVYATVLAGLWLASGRPEGAEQDLLELLGRLVPRARRLWAQTAGPASG